MESPCITTSNSTHQQENFAWARECDTQGRFQHHNGSLFYAKFNSLFDFPDSFMNSTRAELAELQQVQFVVPETLYFEPKNFLGSATTFFFNNEKKQSFEV